MHTTILSSVIESIIMVALKIVIVLLLQFCSVFSNLCVLEPLVTISQPLCVREHCSNSPSPSRRKKLIVSNDLENEVPPLVPLESPSFGHFQSVSDDDNTIISERFDADFHVVELTCDTNETYRSINGSCNNLKNPTWGQTHTPFLRILYPRYSNNTLNGVAESVSGNPLPESRVVSSTIFTDSNRPLRNSTLAVMQWGQLIAHDIGMSPSATNLDIDCCTTTKDIPSCYPITIPKDDRFYSQYNQTCMNLIRTRTVNKNSYNCKNIPHQINAVSHYIDLSHMYGSTHEIVSSLRQFDRGLLDVHLTGNFREFPKLSDEPSIDCNSRYPNITCFHSGDKRVNQNIQLTCLQTILIREHNRIAKKLFNINANWTDETLFQEARNILIAQFQHISYNEWLPIVLGDEYMSKHNLKPLDEGYSEYKSDINGGTINSFMTAAFRIFHSSIQGNLTMYKGTKCPFKNVNSDEGRCPYRIINMSDYMNRPGLAMQDDNFDSLLLGLTVEPSQNIDRYFTTQITEMLFHGDLPFGEDLESFDIQRGRDHGIPNYNTIRELCNLTYATEFEDLQGEISGKNINLLKSVYENVNDIDYFVGSVIENWVQGATVGPTALCIIGEQFARKKYGDRFWYEAGDQNHSFTEDQLQEIRKSSLSRLLCDNSDNITTIQTNSFFSASVEGNELVDCNTIPSINLTKWKSVTN